MSNWGTTLMPTGTGQGNTMGTMFSSAMTVAADTGLDQQVAGAAMGMMPSGPLGNEDQLSKFYHLLAAHPNEVSMFFLQHLNEKNQPVFVANLLEAIDMLLKKNIYEFFNSAAFIGDHVDPVAATELGYSTITQENIDMVISNMVPLQQISMEIQQADAAAMQIIQQAKFQAMNVEQQQQHAQQQQAQQQQMWMQQQQQQQMMAPQRPGIFSSLFKIGAVTAAGAAGGAGAQNVATQLLVEQPGQQQGQQYGQQQFVPGQQMAGQPYNGVTSQPY